MTLRIGVLGAARITPKAVLTPAASIDGVEVTAVAARDRARAQSFAEEHAIALVEPDYRALCSSDAVDLVYNALPAALHHRWTIEALRAGKHVLCEKPLANNAAEAREMVAVAEETGQRLVEAFHWRFHPLADRLAALVARLGTIRSVEGAFCVSIPPTDIRYQLELGGGALMDLGCYPIQWARFVMGAEPTVVAATAVCDPPRVDVSMQADLLFPGGAVGRVRCSMSPESEYEIGLTVTGDRGELVVHNPLSPQLGNRLSLRVDGAEESESVEGESSYHHQMLAVRDHLRGGTPMPCGGADAVANMAVIDAIYAAAGIGPRGTRL